MTAEDRRKDETSASAISAERMLANRVGRRRRPGAAGDLGMERGRRRRERRGTACRRDPVRRALADATVGEFGAWPTRSSPPATGTAHAFTLLVCSAIRPVCAFGEAEQAGSEVAERRQTTGT
jgi:hypothetical protein